MGIVSINWGWSSYCIWLFWRCSFDGNCFGRANCRNMCRSLDLAKIKWQSFNGRLHLHADGDGFGKYQIVFPCLVTEVLASIFNVSSQPVPYIVINGDIDSNFLWSFVLRNIMSMSMVVLVHPINLKVFIEPLTVLEVVLSGNGKLKRKSVFGYEIPLLY